MTTLIIAVIALALLFDFLNGIHDSSNVVATMISSRAFSPHVALGATALANFLGPFIFGVAVAETIGHEIVAEHTISTEVLIAALLSAILWNLLTWYLGFPSSSSHALIGGFIGSVVMGAGWSAILLGGLEKVLIALFASPILGFLVGYLVRRLITLLCWNASPRVNSIFRRGQLLTALALALSHGTNDAQKTMGIIALTLFIASTKGNGFEHLPVGLEFLRTPEFRVYPWIKVVCAITMAAGTAVGGWRIIRTLGHKLVKMQPVHGFAAQTTAGAIIQVATHWGIPLSTTHVISASIMGVGATKGFTAVKWSVVESMVWAWIMTLPVTGAFAYLLFRVLSLFGIAQC